MSGDLTGLELLVPTFSPDAGSRRRAGRGTRLNPVFLRLVGELTSRIFAGEVSVCPELVDVWPEHLRYLSDLRWFAADPGWIFCPLCVIAHACTAPALDLACYGCGAGDALPQVFATAGPVAMVADCCAACVVRS